MEKTKMYIFLDDERENMFNQIIQSPPEKPCVYTHCYTFEEVTHLLDRFSDVVDFIVDFDNDLGQKLEGYDVAKYIVENEIKLLYFKVHSMNSVARGNIIQLLTHYGYKMIN